MLDIVRECDKWWKLCVGQVIEAPPAMLADISNFVAGSYAAELLERLTVYMTGLEVLHPREYKHYKEYLEGRKNLIQRHADKVGSRSAVVIPGRSAHYFARFNFDGWNSFLGDVNEIRDVLHYYGFKGVNVILFFKKHKDAGYWDSDLWEIQIMAGVPEIKKIEDVEKGMQGLYEAMDSTERTVEHELIHMVQSIGRLVQWVRTEKYSDEIGMPPKKVRDRTRNTQGVDPSGGIAEHQLRENEFYTNLMDSINHFASLIRYVPAEQREEFLREFIGEKEADLKKYPVKLQKYMGPNRNFDVLSEKDPKRWELAVKRFMSYLGKNPQIMQLPFVELV
jgi:hypothetical protein